MLGLFWVCVGCSVLLQRWPDLAAPRWHILIFYSSIVAGIWFFIANCLSFPKILDIENIKNRELFLLPIAVCVGILAWKWESAWAGIFIGPVAAIYLWLIFNKKLGRSPTLAMIGCCLVSLGVYLLPLQYPQRSLFALTLCGLAIMIEGVIVFVRYLQTLLSQAKVTVANEL